MISSRVQNWNNVKYGCCKLAKSLTAFQAFDDPLLQRNIEVNLVRDESGQNGEYVALEVGPHEFRRCIHQFIRQVRVPVENLEKQNPR